MNDLAITFEQAPISENLLFSTKPTTRITFLRSDVYTETWTVKRLFKWLPTSVLLIELIVIALFSPYVRPLLVSAITCWEYLVRRVECILTLHSIIFEVNVSISKNRNSWTMTWDWFKLSSKTLFIGSLCETLHATGSHLR